jgi:hypothetical protein
MNACMHHVKILNFKLKVFDPNCSIYFPYQTLVEDQIIYFLKNFAIFWIKRKLLDLRILNHPVVMIFFLPKK